MPWTRRLRGYAAVAEAAILLLWARFLVAAAPMRYWSGSLGVVRRDAIEPAGATTWAEAPLALRAIVRAVERAAFRLPLHTRCLPRAMAVQWMARRRGLPCTLRIGIERGAAEELHAWIDYEQVTIIGKAPDRSFVSILTITTRNASVRTRL